jgi:hypothetical protein
VPPVDSHLISVVTVRFPGPSGGGFVPLFVLILLLTSLSLSQIIVAPQLKRLDVLRN